MRRRLHRSTLLAVVAATLAACGGGGGGADAGGGPDPATVMPPSAPMYLELDVKPVGERREDALAAGRKILRTDDPERKLLDLIRKASEGEDLIKVDYERDIEPWLGERAGMFITDPEADDPPLLFAVAVTDTAKARSAVAALRREAGQKLRRGTYKGVEYDLDAEGTASGVIDDFLILADEPRLKQGVDASKGDSLAESGDYKAAVAGLDDDRVATVYATADTFFGLSGENQPEYRQLTDQVRQAFNLDEVPPMAMGLMADGDRIPFQSEFSLGGGSEAYRRFAQLGGAEVPLVADVPADAWAVYGLPDVGEFVLTLFTTFAGSSGTAAATDSVRESTGLDLEQDLLDWMGDAAVFVRGSDTATLDGALIVEAKDADAAQRAMPKVADALLRYAPGGEAKPITIEGADRALRLTGPSTDKPIIMAVGKGRMIAGYGEAAARAALEPAERLGDTAEYKAVAESLDDMEPAAYLSMPGLLKIIASTEAGSDPTFKEAWSYFEAFGAIASGGRLEGDRMESVVAARLK